MAVRIRCSECRKPIAVDEAFGGSMCRCPYCKSIVMVPHISETVADGLNGSGLAELSDRLPRPQVNRPKSPLARDGATGGSGLQNVVGSRPIITNADADYRKPPPKPKRVKRPDAPKLPKHMKPRHRKDADADAMMESISVDPGDLSNGQLASIPMADRIHRYRMLVVLLVVLLIVVTGACVLFGAW